MPNKNAKNQPSHATMQRELENKITGASVVGLNEAHILSRRPTRLSMALLSRAREENSDSLIKSESK